jgi:hypothetical protein
MPTSLYQPRKPLERSYAKALQLINSRTDLAWKYLKEANYARAAQSIDLIGEVADDFLEKLEKASAKAAKLKKASPVRPKKTAQKKA